jgi:hypothetical protein
VRENKRFATAARLAHTCPVTHDGGLDYETWRRTLNGGPVELGRLGPSDAESLTIGFSEFTQEVFRDRGPISTAEFDKAYSERQLLLARHAVDLVVADLGRAAGVDVMRFDVGTRQPFTDDDFEQVVVSYRGSFRTPVIFSLRDPEATVEVSDNMHDLILDEIHQAWPVCPIHDRGLYPQVDLGDAVWYCRSGNHPVSKIGELGLQT